MGMSTHVVGFKPADEKWRKMKAVYDACVAANVEMPDDVLGFFEVKVPDAAGVEVEIEKHIACKPWKSGYGEGYEVDLKKLPPDVTVLRFYNSW